MGTSLRAFVNNYTPVISAFCIGFVFASFVIRRPTVTEHGKIVDVIHFNKNNITAQAAGQNSAIALLDYAKSLTTTNGENKEASSEIKVDIDAGAGAVDLIQYKSTIAKIQQGKRRINDEERE
jgi:hypothetical protein